jgi:hypothetical protein
MLFLAKGRQEKTPCDMVKKGQIEFMTQIVGLG